MKERSAVRENATAEVPQDSIRRAYITELVNKKRLKKRVTALEAELTRTASCPECPHCRQRAITFLAEKEL